MPGNRERLSLLEVLIIILTVFRMRDTNSPASARLILMMIHW